MKDIQLIPWGNSFFVHIILVEDSINLSDPLVSDLQVNLTSPSGRKMELDYNVVSPSEIEAPVLEPVGIGVHGVELVARYDNLAFRRHVSCAVRIVDSEEDLSTRATIVSDNVSVEMEVRINDLRPRVRPDYAENNADAPSFIANRPGLFRKTMQAVEESYDMDRDFAGYFFYLYHWPSTLQPLYNTDQYKVRLFSPEDPTQPVKIGTGADGFYVPDLTTPIEGDHIYLLWDANNLHPSDGNHSRWYVVYDAEVGEIYEYNHSYTPKLSGKIEITHIDAPQQLPAEYIRDPEKRIGNLEKGIDDLRQELTTLIYDVAQSIWEDIESDLQDDYGLFVYSLGHRWKADIDATVKDFLFNPENLGGSLILHTLRENDGGNAPWRITIKDGKLVVDRLA